MWPMAYYASAHGLSTTSERLRIQLMNQILLMYFTAHQQVMSYGESHNDQIVRSPKCLYRVDHIVP